MPPRGRPPGLTREQVVAAAVSIADADGLPAVTVRQVAGRVGAGAMSLYTYVADKDGLIDLMVDAVAGEVEWPADLLCLAIVQRELMHRHPWLPAALPNRRLGGTNMLSYLERGLEALAATRLSGAAKLEVLALLTGFVAGYVTNEQARAAAGSVSQSDQVAIIAAAVGGGRFPQLAAALGRPGETSSFEALAARIIAGLTGSS